MDGLIYLIWTLVFSSVLLPFYLLVHVGLFGRPWRCLNRQHLFHTFVRRWHTVDGISLVSLSL